MNYRIVKNSKSNLIHYHFIKNIPHNKASNVFLVFFKHIVKGCEYLINLIFAPTKYIYDEVSDTCKPCNDNYYFKDINYLKLKASQRTFL